MGDPYQQPPWESHRGREKQVKYEKGVYMIDGNIFEKKLLR